MNFLGGGNFIHGHGIPRREIVRDFVRREPDLIAFEDILITVRRIRSFLERGESRRIGLRVFSQAIQIDSNCVRN